MCLSLVVRLLECVGCLVGACVRLNFEAPECAGGCVRMCAFVLLCVSCEYLYVCVCVCVFVCVRECVIKLACLFACLLVGVSVCLFVCICVYVFERLCVCVCVRVRVCGV
jgi:hypothetical protein